MVQNSTANQKRLKHQAEKKNDCISSEKKSEKKTLEETAKSNLYSSLTLFMHGEGVPVIFSSTSILPDIVIIFYCFSLGG